MVEVDHVEGKVVNILRDVSRTRTDLVEFKRRYDATFVNEFIPEGEGMRYTLRASLRLKWPYRLAAPFIRPLALARMRRLSWSHSRQQQKAKVSRAAVIGDTCDCFASPRQHSAELSSAISAFPLVWLGGTGREGLRRERVDPTSFWYPARPIHFLSKSMRSTRGVSRNPR